MKLSTYLFAAAVLCAATGPAAAQDKPADTPDKVPGISDKTKGMQRVG